MPLLFKARAEDRQPNAGRFCWGLLCYEPISHAWFGADDLRICRITLNLPANMANENPEIVRIVGMRRPPDRRMRGR